MDIGGVRAALRREPFQPFILGLADGRAIDVPHPDFVALGQRHVFVVHQDDTWSMIEPLLIVSVDLPSAKNDGNGKHLLTPPSV
jgi:hypothetical protein